MPGPDPNVTRPPPFASQRRPFDAGAQLSDNRGLAMKQHLLVLVAAIVAAAAGCGKSSDLPSMKAEASGLVKAYAERVAALDLRTKDLVQRGNKLQLGPDALPASNQLGDVITELLPGMQQVVREAPARLDAIEKNDKVSEAQRIDELRTYSHQISTRLAGDWRKANTKLDAVEAWLFRVEHRPHVQPPTPPATPTPTPAPEPAQPGSDAAGAAGGTMPAGDPKAAGDDAGNAAR